VGTSELAELADFLWDEATAEPDVLKQSSGVVLLCVLDA
jgi:hypothetical protein